MKTELIATYRNEEDGLEDLVMDGNEKHNYRVVMRDSDADATVSVLFTDTYFTCMKTVREFLLEDVTHVETGERV